MIDSITAFEANSGDGEALKEHLWALADHFKRLGITFIFTTEAYSFFESGPRGMQARVSYVADSIILLRLVEERNDVARRINVLKMRGVHHETALKHLRIGPSDIGIEDIAP